jgi:hypothetical protein
VTAAQVTGRVGVDRHGRPVVHRPAAITDLSWRHIGDLLRPAAYSTSAEAVVLRRDRIRALDALLRRYPAAAVDWRWDHAALVLGDQASAMAARLARLTNHTVEAQRAWPDGLDLADYGFVRPLLPFQRESVARLLFAGGGANFSVPGSGKTAVTYAVFAALHGRGDEHAMLVVAPPSAFEAWQEEAELCFATGRVPYVALCPRRPARRDTVVVLNYERLADPMVRAGLDGWMRNRRVLAVFDEAHRAKAGELSRRGAHAAALARRADRTMVLTGTPMPNGDADLEAVFDLVWPGHGERLVDGDLRRLRDRAYVRVTKDELGLPPLQVCVERVALDPGHRRLYDAMARRLAEDVAAAPAERAASLAGQALLNLLAATTNPATVFKPGLPWSLPCGEPDNLAEVRPSASNPGAPSLAALVDDPRRHIRPVKIVRAAQIVAENRRRGRKTLVWSSFLGNVAALEVALARHDPAVVIGATAHDDPGAPKDRRRELARFRFDPDCWALIATPQTLGEGVSLHHACLDQVHVDRGYAAGTWLQAIDRTHRLGLPAGSRPTCTVLVAADTLDERVDEVLNTKVRAMARALGDRTLLEVADAAVVRGDPVAAILGDINAVAELFTAVRDPGA